MEDKVNFTLVGLFVLVLSAGLIGGVLWLSSGKSYSTTYDTYQVYSNESVAGLNLNAPVRYLGVDVGRVRKIELAPNNVEQVRLTLAIERGTPVKVDTQAVLKTQGLTGLAFIELTGGSREAAQLVVQEGNKYPVIQSGSSLIARLDSSVTSLLSNLNQSSESLNAMMDEENRLAVKQILTDVGTLSKTLAARSAAFDSSLKNAAHTMENAARMSDELPQLAQRLKRSADTFDKMTSELSKAATSASATLDSTQQFTSATLPEAHQLIIELRDMTGSLRRLSSELEHNPSALIYGKSAGKRGPGE